MAGSVLTGHSTLPSEQLVSMYCYWSVKYENMIRMCGYCIRYYGILLRFWRDDIPGHPILFDFILFAIPCFYATWNTYHVIPTWVIFITEVLFFNHDTNLTWRYVCKGSHILHFSHIFHCTQSNHNIPKYNTSSIAISLDIFTKLTPLCSASLLPSGELNSIFLAFNYCQSWLIWLCYLFFNWLTLPAVCVS